MNGQLTEKQENLLLFIPVVEDYIKSKEPQMSLAEAVDSFIENDGDLFTYDDYEELVNKGYVKEYQLTGKGKRFLRAQSAENSEQWKRRIELITPLVGEVTRGAVEGLINRLLGR